MSDRDWRLVGYREAPSIPLPVEASLIAAGFTVYVADSGKVLVCDERQDVVSTLRQGADP